MKKNMIRILGLLTLVGSLSACTNGRDPFFSAWYDVYGNYCGSGNPRPGCNFFANGNKIIITQDPYYNGSVVYTYDFWTYTDSYGNQRSYLGYAWQSPDGIIYDSNGSALNTKEQNETSADVIATAAEQEKQISTEMGKILAQKYALAEDKGIMISKALQDWAVLSRDRVRTDDDTEKFSARIYGVSAAKAKTALNDALANKNTKGLEDVNVDIAAHWGTSPETSKRILMNWYKEEASSYGLR